MLKLGGGGGPSAYNRWVHGGALNPLPHPKSPSGPLINHPSRIDTYSPPSKGSPLGAPASRPLPCSRWPCTQPCLSFPDKRWEWGHGGQRRTYRDGFYSSQSSHAAPARAVSEQSTLLPLLTRLHPAPLPAGNEAGCRRRGADGVIWERGRHVERWRWKEKWGEG